MEWALFATGCVIIALVAHSIIVTGKVHRRLIDRLTDITRIEYESEADRNNVSVKYYVTVRNQLAVVLTIAATDSPITMPDHDAALSTVFINNVSQRAASYKLKRQSLDIRPYTTEATLYHLQGKQPMETHSPDRIINPGQQHHCRQPVSFESRLWRVQLFRRPTSTIESRGYQQHSHPHQRVAEQSGRRQQGTGK